MLNKVNNLSSIVVKYDRTQKYGQNSLATFSLAALMIVGLFKGSPLFEFIGIDLTLIVATLLTLSVLFTVIKTGDVIPQNLIMPLFFFVTLVPSIFWMEWNYYSERKVLYLFTLTLLSATAPIYIITTVASVNRFIVSYMILCLIFLTDSTIILYLGGSELYRLAGFDASTIATGRIAAEVFVVVLVYALDRRIHFGLAALLCGISLVIIIATGSRGPLVALIITILVMTYVSAFRGKGGSYKIGSVVIIAALFIYYYISEIPEASMMRYSTLFQGQLGASINERLNYLLISFREIISHPLGIGWGGFARYFPLSDSLRLYPHNIVAEIILEAGWLAGTVFVILIVKAYKSSYVIWKTNSKVTSLKAIFLLLNIHLLGAMFSADINDDRALFTLLGISLMTKNILRQT